FRIPDRRLQRRLRHRVPAHHLQKSPNLRRGPKLFSIHQRPQIILQDVPGRFRIFRRIVRILPRRAFSPPNHSIHVRFHQNDPPRKHVLHAGLKRRHQRHPYLAQRNSPQFHPALFSFQSSVAHPLRGEAFHNTFNAPLLCALCVLCGENLLLPVSSPFAAKLSTIPSTPDFAVRPHNSFTLTLLPLPARCSLSIRNHSTAPTHTPPPRQQSSLP